MRNNSQSNSRLGNLNPHFRKNSDKENNNVN